MNQREKLLATTVAGLLLLIGSIYLLNSVSNRFDRRYDQISDLESRVSGENRTITLGREAQRDLDQLITRSLPSDRTLARARYQAWLLDHAVDVGFRTVKVSPMSGRARGDLYFQHSFLVSGFGDLQQLVEFLYRFYSVDYLHRIGRLNAKPIPDSKELDLSITVEALSLNAAPSDQQRDDAPANRLDREQLAAYVERIVHRNPFAPANHPPRLASPGTVQGYSTREVAFQADATDPDRGDQLTYHFEGEPPAGARLDQNSGQFRWVPPATGEFEVAIRVTDNGLPPQSAVQRVKLIIDEAPASPEAPTFDPATQAFVTGITQTGGEREIWVTVRTEGRVLKLREGDQVSVGSITGVVQRIDASEAELKTDDGRTVIVGLGKSLALEDEA